MPTFSSVTQIDHTGMNCQKQCKQQFFKFYIHFFKHRFCLESMIQNGRKEDAKFLTHMDTVIIKFVPAIGEQKLYPIMYNPKSCQIHQSKSDASL